MPITVVIPSDGTAQRAVLSILNKYGAHKDAAKLMQEYVSDRRGPDPPGAEVRPAAPQELQLPADIAAKFPPESQYAAVKPINDWKAAADAIARLATDWTIEVGA